MGYIIWTSLKGVSKYCYQREDVGEAMREKL